MLIQTVGCTLQEVLVDEKGKAIHSSYEQSGEADQYFDKKQEEKPKNNSLVAEKFGDKKTGKKRKMTEILKS